MPANLLIYGAPGMIRTCDLLVRSQTLYPTELRARLRWELQRQFTTGRLTESGRRVEVAE